MYRLDVYVPESHAGAVRAALCAGGAGALGDYDSCCFSVRGAGQFRPLERARPYLGRPGEVEVVEEVKLEVIVPAARLPGALRAMLEAHPYETPAFQYWRVELGRNPGRAPSWGWLGGYGRGRAGPAAVCLAAGLGLCAAGYIAGRACGCAECRAPRD